MGKLSGEHIRAAAGALAPQLPVALPLLEARRETPRMATLFFPLPERSDPSFKARAVQPGQFVMVWLPGIGERPYAVSYLEGDRFGVTVLRRGPFSTSLHEARPGRMVGFRGPYGRGFRGWQERLEPSRAVLVAGGCGLAPLKLLADQMPGATIIQGSPTAEEVLFRERLPGQIICTEDGSLGREGYPTRALDALLLGGGVDAVYTCGPEAMMAPVVDACRRAGVECQASLERYMKCGFGVCGQCECDGRLVCQDGPVFSADELAKMPSFGRHTRLKSGQKASISGQDYCAVRPPDLPEGA